MTTADDDDLASVVEEAQRRAARQIAGLQRTVDAIVEAAELTATDDEHDPEGATIAYERAQALALLRQAREDLRRLDTVAELVAAGAPVACGTCGAEIGRERLRALPTTQVCIRCAA